MPPPREDPLIGATIGGRYRVLQELGRGGVGVVYEAEGEGGERVAIKLLRKELAEDSRKLARFRREVRAAGAVEHPHIVKVLDTGRHEDGRTYMVQELLRGRDLAHQLEEDGPLGAGHAARVAVGICQALSAAHKLGIIHRDLKPENVFLAEGGAMKVLDFGLSKLTQSLDGFSTDSSKLTGPGSVIGTPYFMSPEQINGISDIDHRTDLYSLGVLLYQALTGDVPFRARTLPSLTLKILTKEAPSVLEARADVPPELAELVARTMAKSPEDRFATAEEMAEAFAPFTELEGPAVILDSWVQSRAATEDEAFDTLSQSTEPVETAPMIRAPKLRRRPKRRRSPMAILIIPLLALILAIGLAAWAYSRMQTVRQESLQEMPP